MINRVVLVGRLTRDVEVRKTQSGISVASFTVACDRRFSSQNQQNQEQSADFISCVAWRQTADFLGSYARKGIDVSRFQGEIDWRRVAGDGIEYAFIRLGYRGYESGKIVLDSEYELT